MQKVLSCAIVGAGSIGGLIDSPKSANIASHAHAFSKHPHCKLVAICEPNSTNQSAFIGRWGEMGVYHSLDALLQYETIDLLAIASPTQFHANALEEALHVKNLQAIICEKPLVATAKELARIAPLLLSSEKKVLIHLMRRYDPSFIKLAHDIAAQKWGKIVRFQGIFTKGLLHNGVHMLAVLSHFFGEIETIKSLHVKRLHEDISGDFEVTCKEARGILSCMEELPYSAFELILWFEGGKVEIKEGGSRIESFVKKPSPLYEGYFSLEHEETLPNTLQHYALHSLEFLLQNDDITCKQILQEQIDVHAKIFETIAKEK
ncbi:Gfo/Idh/MocA family protein [Sulfurospirillum cavolei]|uniref:Gfo/Idh/MocA family protein n=1 Tax=Sulfurospirillum cavolei TaxID=366522 RepID=UPI000764BEE7|nr:Gfo/Idh/MocA family oxidoreductase [Sulfurospirillum cavolei]